MWYFSNFSKIVEGCRKMECTLVLLCFNRIMPWWYYDKKELKHTPSIKDGMEYDAECLARKEGARFIIETGNKMDLGYNTMATGVVYFHRFYMIHSFSSFPKYVHKIQIFVSISCIIMYSNCSCF